MIRSSLAGVLAALGVLAIASPAGAQRVNPDRIIDLHLNFEARNHTIEGSVREGTRFELSIRGEGDFALVPVVADRDGGRFTISVLRVEGEQARTVETITASLGEPAVIRTIASTTVVIERVRMAQRTGAATGSAALARYPRSTPGALLGPQCCVECAGIRACACAVVVSCGFCCMPECCPPPEETSGARFFGPQQGFARLAGACGRPVNEAERRLTPRRNAGVMAMRTR